jgi:hypothetical protein
LAFSLSPVGQISLENLTGTGVPMLIVAAFSLLSFAQQPSPPVDSAEFTPEGRTVIVFGPPPGAVDSLSRDPAFADAYSDFTTYLGKVVGQLYEKDVRTDETNAHHISIRYGKKSVLRVEQGDITDTGGNSHSFGLIVAVPGRAPLVIYGVDTDAGYIEKIEKYYGVR